MGVEGSVLAAGRFLQGGLGCERKLPQQVPQLQVTQRSCRLLRTKRMPGHSSAETV